MLKKSLMLVVFASVLTGAGQCYAAQNQVPGESTGDAKLRESLLEAKAKNKWLKIKLTTGEVIVGKVSQVSNKDFVLVPAKRTGFWAAGAIKYSNVLSLKQQSATARVLDKTLVVLEWTGFAVLVLPLGIPYAIICSIRGIRC